ncbi:zinc finger protein 90-like [Metopolophium dirhodum]|uniref:zinc finger protein 90-like n=1 Tax=Metopolophium dirhodum TaxID=44670 RepID=UPI00298F9E14|nr:zinc finger protein 90-like [Metopolophium dirhodum]
MSLGNEGAIVKANTKIKLGQEITVNYGPHYFGQNNSECMCHSCEIKQTGHFQEATEQGACCINPNSDCSEDNSENEPREDVFTCNLCGQNFLYKCWLSRHIASHIAPIHTSCEQCDRVFKRKDTLQRHIKTVHLKVSHSCDICGQKFSTSHSKIRHIDRVHIEEDTTVHCPKCPIFSGYDF